MPGPEWAGLQAALEALEAALPPTMSPVELLWTAPATLGLVSYGWRYGRAWRQRRTAAARGINGARRLAATIRCLWFLGLAVVFELMWTAGVLALMLPPGPTSNTDNPAAWGISGALFGVQAVLLFVEWRVECHERALIRLLELRARARDD